MRILITAGPTREFLDPVRFISNPATGALGYACARRAAARGHRVTLISGPAALTPPPGITTVPVVSALDMQRAVRARFPRTDALIMTAAVSDWRPAVRANRKLKQKAAWSLRLKPNPDILKSISGARSAGQVVVGFALESTSLISQARDKMRRKQMDLVVADDTSYFGPGTPKSPVFILTPDGQVEDCRGFSKARLAAQIINRVEKLYKQLEGRAPSRPVLRPRETVALHKNSQ